MADRLIDLLITELKLRDAIEHQRSFTTFNQEKYRHLSEYQKFVTSLGIPGFEFYVGKTSKQLKCRTLTGPEKLKLFAAIKIQELLPTLPEDEVSGIQHLWDELLQLNRIFSKRPEELSLVDIDKFEHRARQWGSDFTAVYHDHNVTPYIHAMANHVSEFMKLHGSLLPFTQHGLEKYNDIVTKQYFRSSNHQGVQALVQIIQKQNRLEYLRDAGVQIEKCFEMTCSNCEDKGHNHRTCMRACKLCGHVPHRAHIVNSEGHFCSFLHNNGCVVHVCYCLYM